MSYIETLGQNAKAVTRQLIRLETYQKNTLLSKVADELILQADYILQENQKDLEQAAHHGISQVMTDRLRLDKERLEAIASGVKDVVALKDPIGEVVDGFVNMDGLKILQKRVPLGVIGMIFESRPNVSVDAFCLAFKTGNAIILRGGRDAINSNKALVKVMRDVLSQENLENAVQLVEDTSHEVAEEMMQAVDYIDVLIPRGGAGLIRTVKSKSRVPVIETGAGNVSIYVDASADLEMAAKIVVNAKTQRPSVCNAAESLLVHQSVVEVFLPKLEEAIKKVHDVEFHADEQALPHLNHVIAATDEDFYTEYLDYTMSVKTVASVEEAIEWINEHTTHHSEAIITKDLDNAEKFQEEVDAAAVYVNASTRFTDGFVFGLGAEIGISTQKMHARGPMGLTALTSTKYYVNGHGQTRG